MNKRMTTFTAFWLLLAFNGFMASTTWAEDKPLDLRKQPVSQEHLPPVTAALLSPAVEGIPTKRPYRLGPNDSVQINFFSVSELNQPDVRISPDGSIMLPSLGTLNCDGLTLEELKDRLQNSMAKYLKDPRVSINLTATKPLVLSVLGAVRRAGNYEFNTNPSTAQLQPNAVVLPLKRLLRHGN